MVAALVPGAPQTLSKLASTQTSIQLKWSAPSLNGGSPITSYKVYSNGGSGAVYTVVGSVTSTVFTHNSIGPTGSSFGYAVTAVNAVGEGPLSTSISIILATVPGASAAPTLVSTT